MGKEKQGSVSQGKERQIGVPALPSCHPKLAASSFLGFHRADLNLILGRGSISIFCILLGAKRSIGETFVWVILVSLDKDIFCCKIHG